MFEGRSIEFFEVDGTLSIRNLVALIGSLTSSVTVFYMAANKTLTGEIFAGYCTLHAAIYGVAKWQDSSVAKSRINLKAPPESHNTTINQPEKVNVAGDAITKPGSKKK